MSARGWAVLSVLIAVALGASFWVPLDQGFLGAGVKTQTASLSGRDDLEFSTAQIWTATKGRTAQENAEAHFNKHGGDFKLTSVDEYVAAASTFLHSSSPGVQTARQRDGDIMRFNPSTGEFAVMSRDGTPRTYFILDPAIHGYSSNQDYFNAYIAP